MSKLKIAVLISGRGTNLQALIDAAQDPDYPAEICLVLSNKPGVLGLERAEKAGLETEVLSHKGYEDRESFDQAIDTVLKAYDINLVCLAGFMRLLTPDFVSRWKDRMINIHPSLLPAFKGLDTHARALEQGVRIAGCTIHFVRPKMDDGPILMQGAVAVMDDDTPESLAARILEVENRLYPQAVRLIAEGRVRVSGNRVLVDGQVPPSQALIHPDPTSGA